MVGNSFMVDNFAFGEAGPMNRRCEGLLKCQDRDLFKRTIQENIENPQAFGFNLLQKFSIYFFEPQKVPRIPGEFFLHEEDNFIEIGAQRLSTSNLAASLAYFFYKSLFLISFYFIAVFLLFLPREKRSQFLFSNKISFLTLPRQLPRCHVAFPRSLFSFS